MARVSGHTIMNASARARPMSTMVKAITAAASASASATLPMPSRPAFRTSPATPAAATMPPGFTATVRQLETFVLPEQVSGSVSDQAMASAMVDAWRRDGILQVSMSQLQRRLYQAANVASKRFFGRPQGAKNASVDSRSYAGYVASGEEITDGLADYSEIFTVTKDLSPRDRRVARRWPCHGPCPWPDKDMKAVVGRYMADLGASGETILRLIELGLGVPTGSLTRYTDDGWHHMRVLRFPSRHRTNGKGKDGRGIGSHTDYGLLVLAAQDEVGGLFVRPPQQGEKFNNWQKSAAGAKENESGWIYVPPVPGVFTVFPGDMLQYMTNNVLQSTPHKVGLNTRERFAFAYFHEPNFRSVVKPLEGYNGGQAPVEGIHYGKHFTNMALRNYPDRVTTKRLVAEDRYRMLSSPELRDDGAS
ncbi:2-oxoglutarate-dependent ethylene/succinate-forming enzyme [Tolypocladium ophioglossoides CBS 100239]|uniref:2-oxoglutarate-dependent ethylene/succinate-forming enzyme n=1 Tax=Tolypocladium ophioglossoides (strain CBS 100239) TaxID=1163406 RepID=A0A0L0N3D2_TOLOC|nr:2-oxoglutarate-dependent ethylene/succinate-forming enzyme [Tolypocladium ophioglossoides CBS 100239]